MKLQFHKAMALCALGAFLMPPLTCAFTPHPPLKDVLSLDHTEGKAPLAVRIVKPKELQDAWEAFEDRNKTRNKWGEGFSIDWGDGSGEGDASPRDVKPLDRPNHPAGTHVYSKPGTYTVKADLYDFLPTDGHSFYWKGQVIVTVH